MNNSRNDLPPYTQENFQVKRPNRKGIVAISSDVSIAGEKGHMILQADRKILDNIIALPKLRQMKDCVFELINHYRSHRTMQLARISWVVNPPFKKTAWTTARILFPCLIAWAKAPKTPQNTSYKKIEQALRREKYSTIDARRVAAFIIRQDIENFGKKWPGRNPCIDPYKFQQQLDKHQPNWVGATQSSGKRLGTMHLGASHNRAPFCRSSEIRVFVEAILDGETWLALPSDPALPYPVSFGT
jgi:hypothetical protein